MNIINGRPVVDFIRKLRVFFTYKNVIVLVTGFYIVH